MDGLKHLCCRAWTGTLCLHKCWASSLECFRRQGLHLSGGPILIGDGCVCWRTDILARASLAGFKHGRQLEEHISQALSRCRSQSGKACGAEKEGSFFLGTFLWGREPRCKYWRPKKHILNMFVRPSFILSSAAQFEVEDSSESCVGDFQ